MNSDENGKFRSDLSSSELDAIQLSKPQFIKGLILFLISSAIAIFVFFFNLTIDGESQIVFGFLFGWLLDLLGYAGYWIISAILAGNLLANIYASYIDKGKRHPKLAEFYSEDNWIYTVLFLIGTIYVVVYALHITVPGFVGPEFIVGDATGGEVIQFIVLGVLGIILVGAIFMPFLINYGIIELIGSLLEPLMRPLFKVPGKAALDAVASFLTSSSLAVLITNRLWRQRVYTEREAVAVTTCFSTVSVGFAYLVISTAEMSHMFFTIFAVSFVIAFIMAAIVIRIPPISRKRNVYLDGREQTDEDRKGEAKFDSKILARGTSRAIKRAYTAKPLHTEIGSSLVGGMRVLPKVLTMISAVGVSAMILAEYTPIFNWLGLIFQPMIQVLGISNAAEIAPSMPVGIAEMFLPVLLMAGQEGVYISEQARFFVCVVSMVQVIFFSETASVMLATKLPINVKQLFICFFQRTIIAMPLAAIAAHIFVR